jgi:hypothetical protein
MGLEKCLQSPRASQRYLVPRLQEKGEVTGFLLDAGAFPDRPSNDGRKSRLACSFGFDSTLGSTTEFRYGPIDIEAATF